MECWIQVETSGWKADTADIVVRMYQGMVGEAGSRVLRAEGARATKKKLRALCQGALLSSILSRLYRWEVSSLSSGVTRIASHGVTRRAPKLVAAPQAYADALQIAVNAQAA